MKNFEQSIRRAWAIYVDFLSRAVDGIGEVGVRRRLDEALDKFVDLSAEGKRPEAEAVLTEVELELMERGVV